MNKGRMKKICIVAVILLICGAGLFKAGMTVGAAGNAEPGSVNDPLITKGIRISEVKEASEEQITIIANNLASSTDRTVLSYKRLMQKKLEKEDEIRKQEIKNRGRLLKLAMKIGEKNQQ